MEYLNKALLPSGTELSSSVCILVCGIVYKLPYGEKFSRDQIFADWLLANISRKHFRGLTIAKPRPYWVMLTTPTSHVQKKFSVESAVMASEFSVEAMVRGYHIYEDHPMLSSTLSNLCLDIGRQLDIAAPFPFANRFFQHALHSRISQNNGGRRYFRRQGASRIW